MVTFESVVRRVITEYTGVVRAVAAFVAAFAVAYLLGRFVVEPALVRLLTVRNVNRTYRQAVRKTLHAGVVVAAVSVALAIAGFGSVLNASATVAAAATLAFGFAARDVLGNLVSGVFIVADPKFNIGDWIEWNDRAGLIDDISFRVTRVRTFDNEIITVPNSELATTAVTNPVSTDLLRVTYPVEVGFDADIEVAREIMLETAAADARVLADPEPTVRLREFTDNGLVLEPLFWLRDPDRTEVMDVRSDYAEALRRQLDAAGVEVGPRDQHDVTGDIRVDDGRG